MSTVGGSTSLSRWFALNCSQRSSDRILVELIGAYTLHTNASHDLTLAGMAGVVSLTSSAGMEIGPSPVRLIYCFNDGIIIIEGETISHPSLLGDCQRP